MIIRSLPAPSAILCKIRYIERLTVLRWGAIAQEKVAATLTTARDEVGSVVVLLGSDRAARCPILKPPALTLIQNGRVDKENVRKEMLTEEELQSQLRELEIEHYGSYR